MTRPMSELELFLIKDGENCTIYTLQFLRDVESEFEKFVSKFREDAEYSEDFSRIAAFSHGLPEQELWNVTFARKGQ